MLLTKTCFLNTSKGTRSIIIIFELSQGYNFASRHASTEAYQYIKTKKVIFMTLSQTAAQGKLIMAANSLGLAEDIPARSLAALRQSDLLIFEEDRQARQSLKAAGIHRDYLKFSEHHEQETLEALRLCLQQGGTACYMSDQGMPVVADPGQRLLSIAYQLRAQVVVIPGPSSITAALAACPFLRSGFRFLGFLPREPDERLRTLETVKFEKQVLVLLDTPYRRQALLDAAAQVFGAERQALLALDISGDNEAYHLNSLGKLAKLAIDKLNFVLLIDSCTQGDNKGLNRTVQKKIAGKKPKRRSHSAR